MNRSSLHPPAVQWPDLSRRRFVLGCALGGGAVALGIVPKASAWGHPAATAVGTTPELPGTDFALAIGEQPVDFTGRRRLATAINGSVPGPVLRWREGTEVTLHVTNRLAVPTSIHWHGILVPAAMDGVPGLSFPGIAPGETFTYRFPVRQSGTYWYHSHSRFQEQTGLYGAIVVAPADGEHHPADREHVVLLSDWTDDDPEHIYATLKRHSDYYNYAEPTAPEFFRDVREHGLQQALAGRRMWNTMRMSPSDLSDVSGATYTYLVNGTAPAGNWTGLFRPGERVRLRFINGSSMTFFDVRIPGLRMTVVAADGQDVEPVSVDEFRIGVAETYDVIVEPVDDRAYTVFAQAIDRSGYARATLAPRPGMAAAVPPLDPRARLTMVDMMGAMAMGHGGHAMPDMGMSGAADARPAMARHARTEYGPGVDMHVDMPRDNLDDPGIGLRDNGRRVLTYADLHTLGGPLDPRSPGREIELHLTGNMARYRWSFDGVPYAEAKPIHFRAGERLRIVLVNDTMMNHPIHLHGMWSELENPDGSFQVRKHTINVQPAQRVSYAVTADAPGHWAYHCHMLYHMEAGMFREVVVS
ncbi:copper resistance system multicopper oxidase [Dyella lutea]|uniref:Copper resistance system multicopper oxidase n=1 Tax=Dyella lutea TaxID=2950441 RepID=A0ABT1F6E4_9GAMM|nr:copper resistance system multicopper oxidase [Dyella lutea]MCP1372725.1 copper resistance system multicopper oxidase [Dyella lutea]